MAQLTDQLGLGVDVPRVAKRSTSRVVRRPPTETEFGGPAFLIHLEQALERAGVKPGDSFYVARVPPPDRKSHLGDLEGPPGSRAATRLLLLHYFNLRGSVGATAGEACERNLVDGGWRRVSELVQGGHLAPTGETRENVPGHPARVLTITDHGRAALAAS